MTIPITSRPAFFSGRQLIVALGVCLMLSDAYAGAAPGGCENCHGDPKYFVQYQKLFRYYQDWLTSPHQQAGLSCDDCHGGDPTATDMAAAHQGIVPMISPLSGLFYRNQPDTCGKCHEKEATQFKESSHYKGLKQRIGAPACTTCHSAMNRKPYYRDIVEITCRVCHYENNPGELPMVAEKANEILHRLNIAKGYLNWTRIYYESRGWPNDSKALVDSLNRQYGAIITQGHTFDLRNTDQASIDLLVSLKAIYRQTADELRDKE